MELGHDPWASLRFPHFRKYLISRFSITLASQIQYVVIAQLIYEWTKDPFALGLSGLFQAIPAIFFALPAGHLIDQHGKPKVFAQYSYLACMCITVMIIFSLKFLTGNIMVLYLAMTFIGTVRAFLSPSTFSIQTAIVPPELYFNSSTWDSGLWQVAAVSGPAIGGILYAKIGPEYTFNLVLFLEMLSFLAIAFVQVPESAQLASSSQESTLKRLIEGINFVKTRQILIGAMALDMFAVLFGGAVALLPIYSSEILNVGPEGLGYLRAAPAFGATITGLFLAFLPPIRKAGQILLFTIFGFALATLGFGISKTFWPAFGFLFLTGAFDNISVIIRGTIVKTMTPKNMRARISAVNSIFIGSSNEIGAFESGLTAKFMGTVPAVLFGGFMTMLVVCVAAIKAKKLRALDFSRKNWHET